MSKTACVVLNYRGADSALRLIESLRRSTDPDFEIFAVENGSGDDSEARLTQTLGRENVVTTPVNLGFAGGMNLGLKRALQTDAEFFWIFSKDIEVEPDCLSILRGLWPRLANPGFLGSLTDFNSTDQVYFFRGLIGKDGGTRHGTKGRRIGQIPELRDEFGLTDYVNGSCLFTHRSVLEKVGLISEDYFLYFEDCDWGLRASRLGYQNYVSYRSRVHHHREVGAPNPTAEYYARRNGYLFKKKHGFATPLTKPLLLLKLLRAAGKAKWRGDQKMGEVLSAVIQDIRRDRSGLGPYR